MLERYLSRTILKTIFLIIVVLSGLQFFLLLVKELNDIGKVNYNLSQAFFYILLQLPQEIYLFFQ